VVQLDSVLIPRPRTYEEVEEQVLSDYRREGQIAAARTRADHLAQDLSAGRPWAEAIETIGGEIVTKPLLRGEDLPTTGPLPALDSLVYGPGPDTLKTGGWTRLSTRNGELFVHLDARAMPAGADLAHEREVARQMVLNRRIYDYVEDLRRTHPVTVLRSDLAERLPPPPML
jgi:hypothetical protein